jgi:hypothetical protein
MREQIRGSEEQAQEWRSSAGSSVSGSSRVRRPAMWLAALVVSDAEGMSVSINHTALASKIPPEI